MPPSPGPLNIDADPSLKLGQALIDLDEGRRDEARTALATLAIDRAAPSEVLATLAKLHYQDRSMVEAQALFERLVERNPRDADALAWLGLVPGWVWFSLKTFLLLSLFLWIRATLPRYRYDQLMRLGWKVLIPLALVNLAVSAVLKVLL